MQTLVVDRCSELARGSYRGYSPELISLE